MQSSSELTYDDFEVEIGLGRGREYPIAVLHSEAGEAHETMQFPYDELVLENRLLALKNALQGSGGMRHTFLTQEEQTVQDFGSDLFNALITGEIRNRYDISLEKAKQKGRGLRVKLRIQPPNLAVLPWEFLYEPRQEEYMGLMRSISIVRYPEHPQPIQPLTITLPLRILGMVASPIDLPQLDIDIEKQRVEEAIKNLQENGIVELTWLEGQSWRDLQKAMYCGPWHIFHFIGHGGFDQVHNEGIIALADDEGRMRSFGATELSRLLADHQSLRLVILNSCEGARGSERDLTSSTASILVRRGIPAVLAMQYKITDKAAIEFARTFYDTLAHGLPLDAVVAEARKAISIEVTNTVEWGTPVLYMRSPDGVLFNFQAKGKEELSALYSKGMESLAKQDWKMAIMQFKEVLAIDTDYKDASAKLIEAKKQLELAKEREKDLKEEEELKVKEKQLEKERRDIELRETADEEAKLKAQKEAERLEKERREQEARQAELSALYSKGIEALEAQDWQTAIKHFNNILTLDAGYKDVSAKLKEAEQQLDLAKEKEEQHKIKKPVSIAKIAIIIIAVISIVFFALPPPTPPVTIKVSPETVSVVVGDTQTFTAVTNPITATVTWSSSNTVVGTIDSTGRFTALAAGNTTITASSGSVSHTATVIVAPPESVVTEIMVSVAESSDPVNAGGTSQITVHVTAEGTVVGGASVSLSATGGSLNPTTGTTDANGDFKSTYTAPGTSGTYTISAAASKTGYKEGSGTDQITVSPAGFRIVEVMLRADPFNYTGPCPVTIEFSGRISVAGGAGTVSYKFIRSDGASAPLQTLQFTVAGSKDVSDTWYRGSGSGWEAIKTFDPQGVESSHANFNIQCNQGLVAPTQLSPADGSVFSNYPRTTTLKWSTVTGAASYAVEIDCYHCCQANQWCTDVGKTWVVVPNLVTTSYTFDFVGAQPGRWRVWATDANGQASPKSGWWGFKYTS